MQTYPQRFLDLFIFTNELFERAPIYATVITQDGNPAPDNQGTRNNESMPFAFYPVCKIMIRVPKIGLNVPLVQGAQQWPQDNIYSGFFTVNFEQF